MPELKFKTELVRQARIRSRNHVLDIGCGTATLTLLVKEFHPAAVVAGLDGDPKILRIAQIKAASRNSTIHLCAGLSFQLPYSNHSFDRVLTSMMLHHLTDANKRETLAECLRILVPGGELHVADFSGSNKLLEAQLRAVGFSNVIGGAKYRTIFGELCLWQATAL